jgi:hypothetical protein
MKTILVSVVSMTAVCLAAVPAFAQSSGHSPASGAATPGISGNQSNISGVGNTAPLGPRISPGSTATGNPGIGSGGTARYNPGVLAQAQSLQQRLAGARAAAEQGGSEAPLDTIPVAGEPAVPPNVKIIRGRG